MRKMKRGEKVDVLDIDVEDGAVFGILCHRPLRLQHNVLYAVGHFAFMCNKCWMARRSKEDLEQNVVEEEGAEDAAQLLALLDVPQGESLAEVVPARLLQPSQVQTTLQLAPDNKMSPSSFGRQVSALK